MAKEIRLFALIIVWILFTPIHAVLAALVDLWTWWTEELPNYIEEQKEADKL